MTIETGVLVAGSALLTAVISKVKFFVKKNGSWNCGCGFMDKPLVDDDEIEVKQFDMGDVKGFYIKPKGHYHLQHEEHNIEDSDSE